MAYDPHANQMPEDKHGPKYDNNTPRDWRVGAGESAEGKPGFDKSQSKGKL